MGIGPGGRRIDPTGHENEDEDKDEDEEYFREIAGDDPRIAFGFISDQELLDLYANARAVIFVPN